MSQDLKSAVARPVAGQVERFGTALTIPERMSIDQAVALLMARKEYEEKEVIISRDYDTFPWDGAHALQKVLEKKFGWAQAVPQRHFFGENPPQMMTIDVGPGQKQEVMWGQFTLPTVEGLLKTDTTRNAAGRVGFKLAAKVKRKDEATVRELFDEVGAYIKDHSIYRGKAIKIRFLDGDGDVIPLPEPKFMETDHIVESQLIFSEDLRAAIETNLFTPIRKARDCLLNGIQLKRGVLLGGTYGCGKTLAAAVASKIAVDSGITFIYAERADELGRAVEFAKQYQSPAAVIFCEDIDRSMSGGRTVDMDEILNVVDGIESKNSNIIVVLTTNALESINQAMLRPGRLDAVIDVTPPDSLAVEKLIRFYGGVMVSQFSDLSEVGRVLAGNIPAVIAEVVKRAKLSQLTLQPPGTLINELSAEALLEAAQTMVRQINLLKPRPSAAEMESPLERRIVELFAAQQLVGSGDLEEVTVLRRLGNGHATEAAN